MKMLKIQSKVMDWEKTFTKHISDKGPVSRTLTTSINNIF